MCGCLNVHLLDAATSCHDLLQSVFSRLSERLPHAVSPVGTVATGSETHTQVTSQTSRRVTCADAAVQRLPNLLFAHASPMSTKRIPVSFAGAATVPQALASH